MVTNKLKQITLILAVCLFAFNASSQDFNLNWSDPLKYDDKKDGFFHSYMDANDKNLYVMLYSSGLKGHMTGEYGKMKVLALDVKSKKRVAEVSLLGYKENDKKSHKGLSYYKSVVFNDVIYIFWKKKSKKIVEIYMEAFDAQLKKKGKIVKIYQQNFNKKLDKQPGVFVLVNRSIEKIVIGGELGGKAEDNVVVELKILEKNLKFSKALQVTLPYAKIREKKKGLFSKNSNRYGGLTSTYELGDDGNLHLETFFSLTRKERKERKKAGTLDDFTSMLFGSINLNSGTVKYKEIKFEGKEVKNMQKIVGEKNTKVFGFFSDEDKGGGDDIHGIFYGILSSSYDIKNVKFNYFTKQQLDELFKKDKEDRYEMVGGCMGIGKKKKKKTDTGDELAKNYQIEYTVTSDSDELFLFCSRTDKWSHTHCSTDANGNQTCTTTYYNSKKNITLFKLNGAGKLEWASNLDRDILYKGGIGVWSINDVSVVAKNESFYVIYGNSDKDMTKSKKERKKAKKAKAKISPFEYAVFSEKNGEVKKKMFAVNKIDTEKKKRRTVTPSNIEVINNKFYAQYTKMGYKPKACLVGCGAFWLMGSTSIRKGEGYIGEIEVLEK
ncbi:MAG: hypothetical protein ACJAZ2_001229 [Glaciecola sp.]|jgi:hypothetical protein